MTKRRVASLLTLLSACVMQTAHAFFDPPWITPAVSRASETVSVNIHGGICDVFFGEPGYPQITRNGNAIRILEYGNREDFQDFCIYGIWTVTEPIGAFPPGDYTLTVDFLYLDALFFEYRTITLGVIPFTVTGAAPITPVPIFNLTGLFALALVVLSLALRTLRARRCDHASTVLARASSASDICKMA